MTLQNNEQIHTREKNAQLNTTTTRARRAGPSLGAVAVVYAVLHLASIFVVSALNPFLRPSFPAPDAAASTIVAFFQLHPDLVRTATFFQFGAGIALGIFAVGVAIRLRELHASAIWLSIALVSGLMTGLDIAVHRGQLHEPLAKVDYLVWLLDCSDRGGELSEHPAARDESHSPAHSAHEVPGLRLAHRRGVCAAEDQCVEQPVTHEWAVVGGLPPVAPQRRWGRGISPLP